MKVPRQTKRMRAEQVKFADLVSKFLLARGAKYNSSKSYPYTLDTPFGPLHLSISGMTVTVFSRFDHPERVVGVSAIGLNPYSGKWNHHFADDCSAEYAFASFSRDIDRVLEG